MTPPANAANLEYRIDVAERDIKTLGEKQDRYQDAMMRKFDRVIWALVSLTVTIAACSVVYALTVVSIGGRGP